ncbi:VOC family protein [Streptomyces gobiensis]|uniref:VOC family protein n=1 Tax=Streptomyces gobiensis TaxID=2875706 RepID=UPI001E2D470E|nr:VOC family protein [Streptomyces gobiensis]UGY92004.1 VOC family protein [Streptomyces gobiensis]
MAAAEGVLAEGTPCWADVMLADVEAGKRFYGELFGWTFGEPGPPEEGSYTAAYLDGRQAAGLFRKKDGRMPTVWTIYFATTDAVAVEARIRAAGGQVITAPIQVGSGPAATMAVAADPGGAVFGLWQPVAHRGFEVTDEPGAYIWTEVYTRDKDAVDAFYTEVFGFEVRDISEDDLDYVMWALPGDPVDDDHAIGGRCVIVGSIPAELPAHFLTYFSVADCDAAVNTVGRLGGRTLFPAVTAPYGRFAILVDNQGAIFAVIDPATTSE